jgi:hypothetical protein
VLAGHRREFRDLQSVERMRAVSRIRDAADLERRGTRNFAFGAERIDGADRARVNDGGSSGTNGSFPRS